MEAHQLIHSSQSVEWYTPSQYIEAARLVMGGIDLDPASCEEANRTVQASRFFDVRQDGLKQDWHGRIFLNPPYGRTGGKSNQEIWTNRLLQQHKQGLVEQAILLVNAVTDRKWFRPLWDHPLCFTHHRIRFYTDAGTPTQPTHGNVFVYLGGQPQRFAEIFNQFGVVVSRWHSPN